MINISSILPATAIVAILLFSTKEALELNRRKEADKRKTKALTALLARECELNNWSIKTLRRIFNEINTKENRNSEIKVEIYKKPSGHPFVRVISDDKKLETHIRIPSVHRELMSKFLLDIATLDADLFKMLEPAYDHLAEIEHVKDSLLSIHDTPEFMGTDWHLEGLVNYAINRLDEAEISLKALYRHCTGNDLTKHRLR